ncbi:hypothetical protein [Peribacillus simplex]|uniref:hypothetical protein n=1 Tax=Peribacillus simplex TaxID=1478 RepID=UPI001625D9EC|nr:hypothetical protein [Peribacillus simplex]
MNSIQLSKDTLNGYPVPVLAVEDSPEEYGISQGLSYQERQRANKSHEFGSESAIWFKD